MAEPSWLKYNSFATGFAFDIEIEGLLGILEGRGLLVKVAGNGLKELPIFQCCSVGIRTSKQPVF